MNSKQLLIAGAFYNLAFFPSHSFFEKQYGWKGDPVRSAAEQPVAADAQQPHFLTSIKPARR